MRPNGPVRVCHGTELAEGQRVLKEVFGRSITLLRHGGSVYCVDTHCCHMGGPLGEHGDIEDLGGNLCIKCPWHGRKFDLATGCQVETNLCGDPRLTEPQQRVHATYNGGDGFIWVDLKTNGTMASDTYNAMADSVAADKAAPHGSQQQHGWGLGLSDFENVVSSQDSTQTAYGSPPQPLTPFAGIERKALAPSPTKRSPPPAQINFQARKPSAAAVRRARATEAIRKASYAPPSVADVLPVEPKRARQTTLTDLFSRRSQQQQAVEVAAVDFMDMS